MPKEKVSKKEAAGMFDMLANCKSWDGEAPSACKTAEEVLAEVTKAEEERRTIIRDMPKARVSPEERLQKRCVAWFRKTYPTEYRMLFHVANEGKKSVRSGKRWSDLGGVAGVADIVYFTPWGKPVCIELKTEKGRQSEAQKLWQEDAERSGVDYYLIRTVADFSSLIAKLHYER